MRTSESWLRFLGSEACAKKLAEVKAMPEPPLCGACEDTGVEKYGTPSLNPCRYGCTPKGPPMTDKHEYGEAEEGWHELSLHEPLPTIYDVFHDIAKAGIAAFRLQERATNGALTRYDLTALEEKLADAISGLQRIRREME